MNALEALAALVATPFLGPIKIKLLVEYFGSPLKALQASSEEISTLPGFGAKIQKIWEESKRSPKWERDIELAQRLKVNMIPYTSPLYPKRLLDLPDHPILLYVQGELKPSDSNGIAVIGTRNPTIYGREMGEKFGRDLAALGISVVSGLARGIDTAAHQGALAKGRTIAVIGSGLADIYPRENWGLAKKIVENGVLISEFPMATPPDRQNFPQRNRIISGISKGIVLIEAPEKSGSMITMEKGLAQGKKLFALPGRADIESFRGNHLIIKRGEAKLVENVDDILGYTPTFSPSLAEKTEHSELEKEEESFLNALPHEEFNIEMIEQLTKLSSQKIAVLLMSLILKRAIKEFPGRLYKKTKLLRSNNG